MTLFEGYLMLVGISILILAKWAYNNWKKYDEVFKEEVFEVGDLVRIINYGHIVYNHKLSGIDLTNSKILKQDENGTIVDIRPELVGETGIIDGITITQGQYSYSLIGPSKHAWYYEDQLELVKKGNRL